MMFVWRKRCLCGDRSRGEETPAARTRKALQKSPCKRGARGDLRALPQLVQQHQRIRPSVIQDIPALSKQLCSMIFGG